MPSHPAPLIPKNALRCVRNVLFAALLFGGADLFAQQPNITASQTDAFPSHPDGRAREGDTITYTTTISNAAGAADATGVQLANPTPLNTTDVAGSIQVSPLGFPDSYPAGENMALTVVAPGVLGNDTGIPAPSAVPIAAGPTTQGGTITLNADGSFTYTPATNFTGTDTFTYTVTSIQPPNDTATVTLTVIPPPVASPDGYNTVKNIALSVIAPGVLGNDTTNGAPIVSYGITGNEQTIIGSPTATAQAGSVSLNADGSLNYTPPTDFTGSDTFNYTLSNIGGNSIATVTFTVTCQAIAVTNPTNAAGTANAAFSETFTQTGGTGTTTFALNSGTLPAGLSLSAAGVLSGTPTQTGSFPITVKATDSTGCVGIGPTYPLAISCQTITVTNPATTTGTVDAAFSQSFTQTGAIGTTTFTLNSGTLPSGLTLAVDGTLSGTPGEPGSFPITVKVTDANGCTGIGATYTLVIACQTITVTNPTTSTGTVDAAFSQTFSQSGVGTHTPATFTLNSGTLPTGLTLATNGTLSGTPDAPGSFPITVKVTDVNGCTGIGSTYTLVIACQTITVTNPTTSTGTVDAAFSQTFTQTGVGTHTPATFSLNSGTLPTGLTLAANGTLSGTPGQSGSFPITVKVTDANGCTGIGATYSLTIGCQTITVTNPTTSTGSVDALFSQTFTQTGVGTHTPATFTLNSGTLPSGLTLAANGTLSGTPGAPGSFPITVKVTDANGCTGIGSTYTLVIACQTITVTNPTTTTGSVDALFSQTFTQTGVGTHTPATFTLNSGTLPSGLTLAANGTLSGTPGQPGSFPITVKVTDSNGCTGIGSTYTLVIACQTINVTNPTTSTGTVDAAFSQTFTATGIGTHTPATFTLNSGTLPSGLTLAANGTLSGTPGAPGSFPITVTVTDANGCTGTGSTYNLVIGCQTITVTNPATTTGTVDAPFSETFTQTGAHGSTSFTTASTLPAGLVLSSAGVLSGTPTVAGTFPITVTVTDANGCTGTGSTYNLVIGCQTITVTNPTTSTGTVDAAFSQTFTQSGVGTHTPATFTLNSGTLPSGLTLAANGTLSGMPSQAGSFPITVKVTDVNGCTGIGATYTLVIACQTITVTNPTTSTGAVDAAFSQTFTQTGVGTHTPASFTINSGTLPSGLSLSTAGVLSGTPTQPGTFPITVKVTDANGCFGISTTYNLIIGCQTIIVTNPATTTGAVGVAFSQQFTQTGAHGTATFTTASTLPTGFTLAADGTLSGTTNQHATFPIVVTVTDSNGCTGTSATYNLVINCQAITVTNPTTATGTLDVPFSQTFTQTGAVGTATFTLNSGTLPAGITLATNGTLSGTPGAPGSFPITVKVTDSNGCTGIGSTYTLVIACQTITVTNPVTSTGTVDTAFSQTFTQTGVGTHTPAVFTLNSGTLPSGLTLSSAGVLSGTPGQPGSFPITVKVTDSNGCTGTGSTYTLVIACQTITLTNPSTTTGTVDAAFSQTFTQAGVGTHTPAVFTIESGTLPPGLTLASGINGVLSGTPSQSGTFPITIKVTDANGCTGVGPTYNLVISCQTITVTNPATTTGTVDAPFSQTFTQTGAHGTATFTTASTLPAGLSLSTAGVLSGTPTVQGTFPIVVTVTDSTGCTGASTTYNLIIGCQTIIVTNPATTTGTVGVAFSQQFTQTGAHGTATFTTASTLPTGFTLASDGTLSGTTNQHATFPIVVTVTDSNGCTGTSATYNLVINCQTITVTNPATSTGTVDAPFSQAFTQSGAIGTATFTLNSGSLPGGLTLATNGTLSGTPGAPGSFPITVKVTDSNGCTGIGSTYTLFIACQTITVTNPVTTSGTVDAAFSQTFTQTGVGTHTPAVFAINSGTLPSGLSLSTAGVLSGTPGQPGSFPITVKVTDSNGCTGIGSTYTLVIACQTITVTNPGTTTGTVDAAFSQTFTQSGVGTHTPATFTTASTLPSGLTLSTAGVLSGTPGQPGTFPIVVTVTDVNGCSGTGSTYTLVIACQVITVTNPGTTIATYNTAFSQTFTQTGVGTHTPAVFTVNTGTLPSGLALATNGTLSGTPTQTGNFPITVKVTDANGCTGISSSYALSVPPKLVAESYTDVGNTQLRGGVAAPATPAVDGSTGVGANDTSDTTITYAIVSGPTQGALTTFNTDGTFLYTPAVGNNTTATFVYSGTSNGATATQTATINFNSRVWWVNNTNAGTADGRSNTPFTTMTAVNSATTNNGDFIYVFKGTGTTIGAYTMKPSQQLIGAGATLNVPTVSPLVTITGVDANTPTIGGTVTLANSVTVAGIDMSTAASNGIAGASVTGVSVTARDVTASTGIAVNLTGSGNTGAYSFRSISANGGTNGVVFTNNTGSFNVSGTGTTAGSGGTIQSKTGDGMRFVSANNITLKNMNLTNNAQVNGTTSTNCGATGSSGANSTCTADAYLSSVTGVTFDGVTINGSNQNGINGLNVVDLKILNSTVQNAGNESGESGVFIQNLTGLNTALTNSTFSGSFDWQFAFVNFTSGALGNAGSPFNVSGCTFIGRSNTAGGEDGILGQVGGTSTANISIGGGANSPSHFRSNFSYGVFLTATDTASGILTVNGCDFGTLGTASSYNNSGIGIGISNASSLNYTISNNTIMGSANGTPGNGTGIIVSTGTTSGAASIIGTINANTIGSSGTAGSGCVGNCNGMSLYANGSGPMIFKSTVTNNQIHQVSAFGIQYIGGTITGAVTGTLHINSNTLTDGSANAQAIGVAAAASGAGGAVSTLCADIGNGGANTISGTWDGVNGDAIRVTTLRGSVFTVGGMPGSGAQAVATVTAFVASQNGAAPTSGSNTASGGGTFNANSGAACPLLLASGGVSSGELTLEGGSHESLSQHQLDSIVAAAIERWSTTGLTPPQVATLRGLSFEVADLPGQYLGEANGNHIRVSRNAGGNGWYYSEGRASARPGLAAASLSGEDDAEFNRFVSTTRTYSAPDGEPAGRVDLLTAIMHEMGHALGLPDTYDAKDRDKVMYGFLTNGERRVPATGDATAAKPAAQNRPQFLEAAPAVAPIAIGTIPQGKSVTVTFKVNINNPVPSGTTQISSQGTVSGGNFANVLTDDPDVGGTNDPTVTPLAVPPRIYSAQTPPGSGAVNVPYGPYTFAADGNPAPTFAVQAGSLPPGLTLSAAGVLNGTPTASGTFSGIVVRATNTAGFFDTNPFTITITAPTPTPTPIPTATPSSTATPGGTPTPTPGGNPTPTPGVTPTPTPGGTPGPTPTPATHAINLSTRMRVQVGNNVGIGGFIVTGSVPKRVIVRAIGPSLTHYGVPDVLADPVLELHGPSGFATVINDNWRDTQEDEIQNTGIPPTNDLESAIVAVLNPGAYTAIVRGKNNTSGVALIEVYDLDQGVDSKLANLSTRAFVSTGDNIVIAGFLLSDELTNDRVIVRGVGPSLAPGTFPASAVLANPTLELRDANGALIRSNNDWQDNASQAALIAAAGLALTSSLESGIAETLPPGLYTALLAGLNNGTGIGLVEVYDLGAP